MDSSTPPLKKIPTPGSFPRANQTIPSLTTNKNQGKIRKKHPNKRNKFLFSPWLWYSLHRCSQSRQKNQIIVKEKPWLSRQEVPWKEMLKDVLMIRAAPEFSLPNPTPNLFFFLTQNKCCNKFRLLWLKNLSRLRPKLRCLSKYLGG